MSRQTLENRIHRKLLSLGWRVERDKPAPEGWMPGRAYWEPDYLRRLGFHPATVIDVGVGCGTPSLYQAFPAADLLLVEPVAEFSAAISAILSDREGIHVDVALGARAGVLQLQVDPGDLQLSSFFARGALEDSGAARSVRDVRVDTLDHVLSEHPCRRPYGLKIDTEGAELEVIAGASETLRHTEFVIAETAVPPRFEGGYHFAEMIAEMDRRGFAVCDILDIGRAPSSRVTFVDLVFQRRAGG